MDTKPATLFYSTGLALPESPQSLVARKEKHQHGWIPGARAPRSPELIWTTLISEINFAAKVSSLQAVLNSSKQWKMFILLGAMHNNAV